MANTPAPTAHPPGAPTPAAEQPKPSVPGGMASDPALAVANEIVTNIKGAADRFRTQVENTPALKALMDQTQGDLVAGVADTIRKFVDEQVSKATGGMAPPKK